MLGFIIFSFGISLSIKSTLGVTATSALPVVLSVVVGDSVGTMIFIMGIIYVVLQILILRKEFKIKDIGQIILGFLTGVFVDFFNLRVLGNLQLTTYMQKFVVMLLSMPVIALGLSLIVNMYILPSPTEGFVLAIADKTKKPFPKIKVIVDCVTLVISILLFIVFSKKIEGIREGTILNAIFIGIIIGFFNKVLEPIYKKVNLE